MYVGLKQPRGDGERYVTPARAAAKYTIYESSHNLTERIVKNGTICCCCCCCC